MAKIMGIIVLAAMCMAIAFYMPYWVTGPMLFTTTYLATCFLLVAVGQYLRDRETA